MKTKEYIAAQLFILSVVCDNFPIIITDELIDKVYNAYEKQLETGICEPSVEQLFYELSSREKYNLNGEHNVNT